MADEKQASSTFDLLFWACALSSVVQTGLIGWLVAGPIPLAPQHALMIFGAAATLPLLFAWRKAVLDGRLPATPSGNPKHQHISGLGFLALLFAVGSIVAIAHWAETSPEADRYIRADFGFVVVISLAVAFSLAAIIPLFQVDWGENPLIKTVNMIASPFGRLLSVIDSWMVFSVAGGAGASQSNLLTRYAFLACSIIPCAVLGALLPPPYGIAPVAWGFVVALSISRRWAWVEDDRESYMMNRRNPVMRIGFAQDLRDEALLSFMSMFFLVPFGLRQVHMWAAANGTHIFGIDDGVALTLSDWIGFYGTELAKAVPFVDWAEIYRVEGRAEIRVDGPYARHLIFATRVLVDLVFLAALLQALSILARNGKQVELFKAGKLDRLDPFIEPREFRKFLVKPSGGEWTVNADAVREFPENYDPVRLGELSADEHYPISLVAKAVRKQFGTDDSARFHEQLIERAFAKRKDADAIDEIVTAIRVTGVALQADDLDRVRIELNGRHAMNAVREDIMRLIVQSPESPDRMAAVVSALIGETTLADDKRTDDVRDKIAPVRRIAMNSLRAALTRHEDKAIRVVREVAEKDPSGQLRKEALQLLRDCGLEAKP